MQHQLCVCVCVCVCVMSWCGFASYKYKGEYNQEPMSAAKRCEGAYESCDPDIVSGSLPYMECVFTNCTLADSGLYSSEASKSRQISHAFLIWHGSSSTLRDVYVYGGSYSPMGFMGSWYHTFTCHNIDTAQTTVRNKS